MSAIIAGRREMRMYLGMPTLIENSDLEETAELCHELGLDFIELNMNLPQYQLEILGQTSKLLGIAEKYGIFYTIHLDEKLNVCDFNRAVTAAYLETVSRAIEAAKNLQAPVLNMHMNHGVDVTLPDRKVALFEKYNDRYMEDILHFKGMCEKALSGTDIYISIENTDGFREYEKAAIECLLESSVFTLTWDIGHSHMAHNTDVPFLLTHRDKLKHFHIHDSTLNNTHLELGTGEIDLRERLGIAKECSARCVIETKTIKALRGSVKWLEITQI